MTTDLLPFDLETALREPERVRLEDEPGVMARRIVHLPEAQPEYRVLIVWKNGLVDTFTEDGRLYAKDTEQMLFLAPKTRKVWVRVFKTEYGASAAIYGSASVFDTLAGYDWLDSGPTEIEIREDA